MRTFALFLSGCATSLFLVFLLFPSLDGNPKARSCGHDSELAALRAEIQKLQLAASPKLETALASFSVSEEPARAAAQPSDLETRVQELETEIQRCWSNHEKLVESTLYDLEVKQADDARYSRVMEELRRLRAIFAEHEWVQFQTSALYQELTPRQQDLIYDVMKRLGEPLSEWQIRELAECLPRHRDMWKEWSDRYDAAKREVGLEIVFHPKLNALREERNEFSDIHEQELLRIFVTQERLNRFYGYE